MKIYSVFDPEYRPYGKVLEDYDTLELTAAMQKIPMPGAGVSYEASIPALEGLPVFRELSDRGFGGMPIQLGMCWGYNTRLNCLEYHRDSEINIGSSAYILLLAKLDEVRDGVLDTALVKAFYRRDKGVPRRRGSAPGDEYRLPAAPQKDGGGQVADCPQQVASCPPGKRGSASGGAHRPAGRESGYSE